MKVNTDLLSSFFCLLTLYQTINPKHQKAASHHDIHQPLLTRLPLSYHPRDPGHDLDSMGCVQLLPGSCPCSSSPCFLAFCFC